MGTSFPSGIGPFGVSMRSVHSVVSGTIHPAHPHPSPTPTSYPTLRRARTYYRRRALRSRTRVEAARAGAGPAHKTQ